MSDDTVIRSIDEAARRAFEQVNRESVREPIEHFLPPKEDARYLATLEELVHIELELAWKSWRAAGRREAEKPAPATVESYLARFPELNDRSVVRRMVEQEYLVRTVHGDQPSVHDYCRRFPTIIDKPAELETLVNSSRPPLHAERFGERYTEARLFAQGGIGRVWLVRDRDIGRRVALKQLLPHGQQEQDLKTRFMIEAKIAGQLEHPNIVPVYEFSQDELGERFYTMRFVDGRTLNEAVEAFHRAAGERRSIALERAKLLDAFVAVCNAVGYAHARGIVHRDLKGENIILGEFGEVFVLDWGLAKVMDGAAADKRSASTQPVDLPLDTFDARTMAGDVMGTPGYMSPEQAMGNQDQVDHRSDIYSLGAILYQILTGRTPFSGRSVRELIQAVVMEAPQRPREVVRDVPPPLEAVCMTALAKRPDDRYQSAGELAEDVRRFLADEAVSAYREPWRHRAARWARRHRAWVRAAAVALVVVTGVSLVATLLVDTARRRAESARDAASRAQREEARERARAESNFEQARSAVDQLLTRVAEGPLKDVPHMQEVGRLLLEDALGFYRTFVEQKSDDPQVQREAARALRRVADIRTKLGQYAEAEEAYREAIRLQQALAAELRAAAEFDQSQTHTNLAHLLSGVGKHEAAEAAYREALRIAAALAEASPAEIHYREELALCHHDLATHLSDVGRPGDAEEHYEQSRTIQEKLLADAPAAVPFIDRLARTYNNLGLLFRNTDRLREAETPLRRAVDLKRQLVQDHAHVAAYRYDLATSLNSLGVLLWDLQESEQAEAILAEAIDLQRGLAIAFPAVPDYAGQLGASLHNFAELKLGAGEVQAARDMLNEAITFQSAALRTNPQSPMFRIFLRNHLWALADALVQLGDYAAVSDTANKLPLAMPAGWEEYHRAAGFLAKCVSLAKADAALDDARKQELADTYAARAVELLRQAIERGFRDVAALSTDQQFAPLRERPNFQELVR